MGSLLLGVPEEILQGLPLGLATLVGTESLLRHLQSLLVVLGVAGIEQHDDSLLTKSTDFIGYLPGEFDSSACSALLAGLLDALGLLLRLLDYGGDVTFVATDSDTLLPSRVLVDGSLFIAEVRLQLDSWLFGLLQLLQHCWVRGSFADS